MRPLAFSVGVAILASPCRVEARMLLGSIDAGVEPRDGWCRCQGNGGLLIADLPYRPHRQRGAMLNPLNFQTQRGKRLHSIRPTSVFKEWSYQRFATCPQVPVVATCPGQPPSLFFGYRAPLGAVDSYVNRPERCPRNPGCCWFSESPWQGPKRRGTDRAVPSPPSHRRSAAGPAGWSP